MVLYVLPVGLMKIAPDVNLKNVQDETSLKRLERGGHYKPSDCEPREKTAIIIPYRDRDQHLKVHCIVEEFEGRAQVSYLCIPFKLFNYTQKSCSFSRKKFYAVESRKLEVLVTRDFISKYSKTCLKRPLKKDQNKFQDRLSLNVGQKYCRMLQESILQYFRPSLSYHLSLRPLFCLSIAVLERFYYTYMQGKTRQKLILNNLTANGPGLWYVEFRM